MALEDKFIEFCDNEYSNLKDNASNCAEVANQHALNFALWLSNNPHMSKYRTIDQLLDYFNENYN